MPYLGFFDRIKKADVFVVLDNVQYQKNAFINRNKIKNFSKSNIKKELYNRFCNNCKKEFRLSQLELEHKILDNLVENLPEATVIIVTHRAPKAFIFNNIFELRDNKLLKIN